MNKFKDFVEQYFNLKLDSKTRKAKYVRARWIYFYLCRKYTALSYSAIGTSIGMDHASVMYGEKELENVLRFEPLLKQQFDEIIYSLIDPKGYSELNIDQLVKKYNNLLIENAQLKMEKNTFKWGKKLV
jgi:hypothetical protein